MDQVVLEAMPAEVLVQTVVPGTASNITGSSVTRAGGGGGGSYNQDIGLGGGGGPVMQIWVVMVEVYSPLHNSPQVLQQTLVVVAVVEQAMVDLELLLFVISLDK